MLAATATSATGPGQRRRRNSKKQHKPSIIPASAGIHAWTGGAVGTMTLAVMTRASLGHTGRTLAASAGTQTIYAAVIAGALARICAALHPEWFSPLLWFAGTAWSAAFLGFATLYGSALCSPRAVPAAV